MSDSNRADSGGGGATSALPGGVWVLGLGSMLMDISSELVHSLLPVLLASVLGASMIAIGVIEGVAEATAAVARVFSGALSDRLGRRKPLVVLGYGLAALTKPVFALAGSVGWVFAARFVDRIGKGIREAPRDALLADIAPRARRSAAYGLRQALDSVGAFLGPLAALGLLYATGGDIRGALWVAVVPAVAAVALLGLGVREPPGPPGASDARAPFVLTDAKRLGGAYWAVVSFGGVLALARFSEAFLVLRARDVGLAIAWAPAVMVLMNLVYAAAAYPAGAAGDRAS